MRMVMQRVVHQTARRLSKRYLRVLYFLRVLFFLRPPDRQKAVHPPRFVRLRRRVVRLRRRVFRRWRVVRLRFLRFLRFFVRLRFLYTIL